MENTVIEMRPKGSFLHEGFVDFCEFLRDNSVKRILEIGAYAGESLSLYKEIIGEDVLVVCIDPYDTLDDENDLIHNSNFSPVEDKFNEATGKWSKYVKCKMYSQDIHGMFADGFFDCLYVDGLHTYNQVKLDLQNYISKVRHGGLIAGHDFEIAYTNKQRDEIIDFEGNDKLRKAVSAAVREIVGEPEFLFGDSSWAKIKQ